MKLVVALLLSAICLALPASAPEAQDRPASEPHDAIENLTTVPARQQGLAARLKSAQERRQANDLTKAAQLLTQAGHLQLELNLPNEALATFQESLELAEQTGDPRATVDALNGFGSAHIHKDEYEDGMKSAQRAIEISE